MNKRNEMINTRRVRKQGIDLVTILRDDIEKCCSNYGTIEHKCLGDELGIIYLDLIRGVYKTYFPDGTARTYKDIIDQVIHQEKTVPILFFASILALASGEFEIAQDFIADIAEIEGYELPVIKSVQCSMLDTTENDYSGPLFYADFDEPYDRRSNTVEVMKELYWVLLNTLNTSLYQLTLNMTEIVFHQAMSERFDYDYFGFADIVDFYRYYLSMDVEVCNGGPFKVYVDIIDILIEFFDSDFYLEDHRIYLHYLWMVARFNRYPEFTPRYSSSNYILEKMLVDYPRRIEFILQKVSHLLDEVPGGAYEYEIVEQCKKGLALDPNNDFFYRVMCSSLDEISKMGRWYEDDDDEES